MFFLLFHKLFGFTAFPIWSTATGLPKSGEVKREKDAATFVLPAGIIANPPNYFTLIFYNHRHSNALKRKSQATFWPAMR
jgi:hypothetical protein